MYENILVRRPERKKPLGRHRHSLDDNIRMVHREIRTKVVDWVHVTEVRDQWLAFLNVVMNFRVP
jgi:hypothetical protein